MEYGLIGERLGHSFSKIIHEQLTDYNYTLTPLSKEEFIPFMEKKQFQAINVTIPYKRDVIPYLTFIDEKAKAIGAVNTIVNKQGTLYGYNTDYTGFIYTLKKNRIDIQDRKVLVLGNGGASKAVIKALEDLDASEIQIVKYKAEEGTITYEEAAKHHKDASIIINTSPVGMYPNVDASPINLSPYHKLEAAIDLIYNPLTTKFLADAIKMNITAVNGLEMLVAQAKYAVEYFLDTSIDDSVIDPICKNLLNDLTK